MGGYLTNGRMKSRILRGRGSRTCGFRARQLPGVCKRQRLVVPPAQLGFPRAAPARSTRQSREGRGDPASASTTPKTECSQELPVPDLAQGREERGSQGTSSPPSPLSLSAPSKCRVHSAERSSSPRVPAQTPGLTWQGQQQGHPGPHCTRQHAPVGTDECRQGRNNCPCHWPHVAVCCYHMSPSLP